VVNKRGRKRGGRRRGDTRVARLTRLARVEEWLLQRHTAEEIRRMCHREWGLMHAAADRLRGDAMANIQAAAKGTRDERRAVSLGVSARLLRKAEEDRDWAAAKGLEKHIAELEGTLQPRELALSAKVEGDVRVTTKDQILEELRRLAAGVAPSGDEPESP
jgi:hypothetical protein